MDSQPWVITLRVYTDASKANQLHRDCLAAVRGGVEVLLDWSETQHLHASVIQILIALRAQLAAEGRTWKVQGTDKTQEECPLMLRVLEAA